MKDTLLYLLKNIVDHPEDASIEEENIDNRTTLTIHAHEEDMGKIIGKNGRIIRAIRDIIKILATKKNAFVSVIIAE